jgi:hypothetical protein
MLDTRASQVHELSKSCMPTSDWLINSGLCVMKILVSPRDDVSTAV